MTNAEYIKAIDKRTSRRTYRTSSLSKEIMQVISEMTEYVNEQTDLDLKFIEDGTPYFTLFSGKFSLVALCGPDTELARIHCGYYGETIVLQCVYHGLGTCWVTGTYNENKLYNDLKLPKGMRLYGVITIGNVKPDKSFKEKMMYNATHKTSKPYQKMYVLQVSSTSPFPSQALHFTFPVPLHKSQVSKTPSFSVSPVPLHFSH